MGANKRKPKDITGQKFNRLTAINPIGMNEKSKTTWLFSCECGVQKTLIPSLVVGGYIKSCGCLKRDGKSNAMFSHGGSGTRLYKTFLGMHRRCEDVKNAGYKDYGERGIKVSDEWQDFVVFRDWALNNGYSDDLTMDRIDNDKGYESSNMRWTNKTVQTRNRRNTLWHEIDGVKKTLIEWCESMNVKYSTALERHRRSGYYFREDELRRLSNCS